MPRQSGRLQAQLRGQQRRNLGPAVPERRQGAVRADLDRFDAMLADSADLKRLVRSPVFSADAQAKALAAVLDKAGISGTSANFLKVLTANRRLFAVVEPW